MEKTDLPERTHKLHLTDAANEIQVTAAYDKRIEELEQDSKRLDWAVQQGVSGTDLQINMILKEFLEKIKGE